MGRKIDDQAILSHLCEILPTVSSINITSAKNKSRMSQYEEKFVRLQSLLNDNCKEHMKLSDTIKNTVLGHIDEQHPKNYFRKGDWSLHNTLTVKSKVSGLIDFDEWGMCAFKLVNCAEIIFSYSRIRNGVKWSRIMKGLVSGKYDLLPDELEICKMIDHMECEKTDMEVAALVAWIDHVYYDIQNEKIIYNRERFNMMCTDVLNSLSDVY